MTNEVRKRSRRKQPGTARRIPGIITGQRTADLNAVTKSSPKARLKERPKTAGGENLEKRSPRGAWTGVSKVLLGKANETWDLGVSAAKQLLTGPEAAQRLLGVRSSRDNSDDSQEAEVSTPEQEAASKMHKDAGEVKSSRDAASETEGQIDLICVHTNGEHQRMIGNYNTTTRQIAVRPRGSLTCEAFCKKAGCEEGKPWKESIFISGDPFGRTLKDWLLESCEFCKSPSHEEQLLICSNDDCQRLYHIYCLRPPLERIPPEEEDWFCPRCS